MALQTNSILTTHVGSLPRPEFLFELLIMEDKNEEHDQDELLRLTTAAVDSAVSQQVAADISIVGDGEMSKSSYTHYVKHRLAGVATGQPSGPPPKPPQDQGDHPDVGEGPGRGTARGLLAPVACEGTISYEDTGPVKRDIANLAGAAEKVGVDPSNAFINSAAPATLAHFIQDRHYENEELFLSDLASAMRTEYEAILDAGFLLQIDCPDLAMIRHMNYQDLADDEFIKIAERNVEALNHATDGLPRDRMRMHVCWGNYPGPHTHDLPIAKLIPTLMKANPQAILFEAANPAHAHEWEDWQSANLNDDTILIPGVIDTTTNLVETPRLIAQRLKVFANIVGKDRVIGGTDCGFGTVAGREVVAQSVVWKKLANLAEGAALATSEN
ncbi:cobalamin-independent methionine synthase II family protein [Gammaproteobacteria bacterium]|nr:cobalamin-independent methionine synthase II family protein [Gammaproteobacteria bacterium]